MATLKELQEIEIRINKLLAKKAKLDASSKALFNARMVLSNNHPTMEVYEYKENIRIPYLQVEAWYYLEGQGEKLGEEIADICDELHSLGYYKK